MMNKSLVATALFIIAAGAGLSPSDYGKMPTERDLGSPLIGGSFTMISHDSSVVTSADLAGRPSLVVFGYTRCSHFCSVALSEISAVFNELRSDKKVAALFVTVDPEQDTPAVLKAYLENFDSRIIGLTGDPQKTAAIAKAFGGYANKVTDEGTGDYWVGHSGDVYLLDKRGRFVGAFDLERPPQEAARELESYL